MYVINLMDNWKVWDHYDAIASSLMHSWCKENCEGWYIRVYYTYSWKFEKLEDSIAFKLRWDDTVCY